MPPAAPNTLVTCLVTCLITMRRKGTPLGRESHQAITVKMASREDDGHLRLGQPVMGPVRARAGAHAAGAAVEFVFPGQQLMRTVLEWGTASYARPPPSLPVGPEAPVDAVAVCPVPPAVPEAPRGPASGGTPAAEPCDAREAKRPRVDP